MVAQALRLTSAFGLLLLLNVGPAPVWAQKGSNGATGESTTLESATTAAPVEEITTTIADKGPYWNVTGDCKIDPNDEQCIDSPTSSSTNSKNYTCDMTLLQRRFLIGNIEMLPTTQLSWVQWLEDGSELVPLRYEGLDWLFKYYQEPNTTISWTQPKSTEYDGWRMCARRSPGAGGIGHASISGGGANSNRIPPSLIVVAVVLVVAICALCVCVCCCCRRCRRNRREAKLKESEKKAAANDSEASTMEGEASDASERV